MSHKPYIDELIADAKTGLMIRSKSLNEFDQVAISEECREWLHDDVSFDEVLRLETLRKKSIISR